MVEKKRNSNIELLRILLMLMVCIWHMYVHGLGYRNVDAYAHATPFSLFMMAILVPHVNCFMLISGYYSLKFSMKKILSLAFQASFYYWAIAGSFLALNIWSGWEVLKHILPISTYVWWFLSFYVVILFLSPILNKGLTLLEKKERWMIMLTFFVFNSIGSFIYPNPGTGFLNLLFIYCLGRCLSIELVYIKKTNVFLTLGGVILTQFIISSLSPAYIVSKIGIYGYNNPLIIVQAVCMLYIALSFKPHYNKVINFLGSHCLSIYLITELVSGYIYDWWGDLYKENMIACYIAIGAVCLLCMLVDIVQSYLNQHFIKATQYLTSVMRVKYSLSRKQNDNI